jgi:hypothetical protein
MKQCPTCKRTFNDETLTYCLADGSLLSAPYDPDATQRLPLARPTEAPPTEVSQSQSYRAEQTRPANNALPSYLIVALLALLVGGGAVALFKFGGKETPSTQPSSQAPAATATPTPQQQRSPKEETKTEQKSPSASSTLTANAVNNLIDRWVSAQNARDFTKYQSCYGASFEGAKRTSSGQLDYYNFNSWMRDRRRMFEVSEGLNVEVKNLRTTIEGDTATVEFDQYFRSFRYSDWGPKVIRIQLTSFGEKIIYEELKASYPL